MLGYRGRCVEGVDVLPWKSEGYCFVLLMFRNANARLLPQM